MPAHTAGRRCFFMFICFPFTDAFWRPFTIDSTLKPICCKKTFATFAAEGGIKGEQCNEALLEKEKQQMTPAQVLLTAAIAVAVGFWVGFDLGYTLGHDAGKRGAK